MKLYLASKSPRRRELLAQMNIPFELLLVDTPEIIAPEETAEQYSMRVTKEKLEAAKEKIAQEQLTILPVLCADTEVVLDGKILGKPQNDVEAFTMLKSYSERSHEVITSVGVNTKKLCCKKPRSILQKCLARILTIISRQVIIKINQAVMGFKATLGNLFII